MNINGRGRDYHSHGSVTPTNGSIEAPVPSKSFLNLTTSALSGVFGSQVSLAELNGDVISSSRPQTPSRLLDNASRSASSSWSGFFNNQGTLNSKLVDARESTLSKKPASVPGMSNGLVPLSFTTLAVRVAMLFASGVAYGQLSKRLHDNHQVTSNTLDIDHTGIFSLIWGSQGIVLGFLLPFFDWMFPEERKKLRGKGGADWSSIVRAVAAFLGIAYGMRKIAWTSTLQAAFYWGMVNPCLWFILDATRNGFILSSLTAIVGTVCFAIIFPDHLPDNEWSEAYLSVTALVASVFFCCSICFGNLGRRLLSFDQARLH
jgi:hypothetical protein